MAYQAQLSRAIATIAGYRPLTPATTDWLDAIVRLVDGQQIARGRELGGYAARTRDALLRWRDDPNIAAVAIRGMGREGPFGMFCAGGDIRFFHQAALAGDPVLEEFFTEEYALNHLIHAYPKPYLAFMDGIVMGGGMGIATIIERI